MNTIVLVHGAWRNASSWDKVAPLLKASGHEVIIVSPSWSWKGTTLLTSQNPIAELCRCSKKAIRIKN
jgi:hypothetical protein